MIPKKVTLCLSFAAAVAVGACDPDLSVQPRSIEPICLEEIGDLADEVWVCPETLTTECDAVPAEIYFTRDDGQACDVAEYVAIEGPFAPGEHRIPIHEEGAEAPICVAQLEVVDTIPPVLEPATIELWPPNHATHTVTVDECLEVVHECDPEWDARFVWVSSDEPADAVGAGDGHTLDDVFVLSDMAVQLRAERAGDGNGRVYALGILAEDGSGNQAEAICHVQVPHDQGEDHPAIEDSPVYIIDVESSRPSPGDDRDGRPDESVEANSP